MIPLLFAAALQSEIVLQTNVFEKFSCGAGCHKKVEQLTNMVEIGDGWRKIKVKHTPYIWTREGGLEQRAPVFDSPIGTGGTTSWNYSNCKTNIFTNRRREYFAAPPAPEANRGERNLSAFTSSGKPNFFSKNGSVFQRWRAMCPETEAARRGTEEVKAWWDRVINMLKDEQENIKKEQ